MATAAQKAAAEEAADQADPVHADPTQTGVKTDAPEAELGLEVKGQRYNAAGRALYPWEVDAKDQVGPAGVEHKAKKKN